MTGEHRYQVSRVLRWLAVIACPLFVAFTVWQAVASDFEGDSLHELAMTLTSPISLTILVGAAVNVFLLPTVHRFNLRFRAGRHGDYASLPLAPHQPNPHAPTLPLPTTITMRSRWSAKIPSAIFVASIFALALAIAVFSADIPLAIAYGSYTANDLVLPIGISSFFFAIVPAVGLRPERET
jgi:hypothetical protein